MYPSQTSSKTKMTYSTITCSSCGLTGHNMNGCCCQDVRSPPKDWVSLPRQMEGEAKR